ncbi:MULTISPECIES: hypothetical protein [unclassified Mesorhizobium]|uniref:hypothetical protein n=1 Tax=unclassified Mesorhizobium TaxID=325217 RepID=UPI001677E492|nr:MULTISPECIES: hypothetical protein [unclassified Mesorhizobium]
MTLAGAEVFAREVGIALAEQAGMTDLEQFQEKCVAVFRPELRKNKEIERFAVSMKR